MRQDLPLSISGRLLIVLNGIEIRIAVSFYKLPRKLLIVLNGIEMYNGFFYRKPV